MATLVLTTVGTLIGGPIGGAIGALIGNGIDHSLLAPSRKGPRLGDLSVQTSSYGSAIPKIFGTMRVAGTVIWATDLREDAHSSGGGKSGPKTTSYSYSANFAVALSGRRIAGVGRIWADGNLLRGSAGDWKSETGFRLYWGDEDQPVDPLIASAEGIGSAPAHRGIAYVVFEGLQLADYGNRIPSLTFEVFADEGDVTVADIAVALGEGALAGSGGASLGGYAASGESVRAALEALAAGFPMPLSDDGMQLRIAAGDAVTLDDAALGASDNDRAQPARVADRRAAASLPDEVALSYYDPDRDYQAGLQRARRDGIGVRSQSIELAASLSAAQAKATAEQALARAWAGRTERSAQAPWRWIEARAGSRVTLDGVGLRVKRWALEKMVLSLSLTQEEAAVTAHATAGRATSALDASAGTTVLALLDLPPLSDTPADALQLWLAAAGTGAGWRRAEASLSLDNGASWSALGRTALPAVMGIAVGVIGDGPRDAIDGRNAIEIELLHDGMTLQSADLDSLIAGANPALLGDELFQFGDAEQLTATRWRLSRLIRGRRGSEWAMAGHGPGERFVLLDEARLLPIAVPLAALGTVATVGAVGPGDGGVAVNTSCAIVGRALRPPAPVHLSAERASDGAIRFGWVRRSRIGWAWIDGSDAPLGEDAELYAASIQPEVGAARTVEVGTPEFLYDAAMQAADGAAGAGSVTLSVSQLGTRGPSLPAATATFTF